MVAEHGVNGDAVAPREHPQSVGVDKIAAGRGYQFRSVGHGIDQPRRFQPGHCLVDRTPGPAGYSGQFQAVQEWHGRQGMQQFRFTGGGPHSRASPFSPLPFPLICCCGPSGGGDGCWPLPLFRSPSSCR